MARIFGDFNDDGTVDARDSSAIGGYVTTLKKCGTPESIPTQEDVDTGDVLKFGKLNMYDSKAILTVYAIDSTKERDWVCPKTEPSNWATAYKKFYYTDPQTNEKKPMSVMTECPSFDPGGTGYIGPYWIHGNFAANVFPKKHNEEHDIDYIDISNYISDLP